MMVTAFWGSVIGEPKFGKIPLETVDIRGKPGGHG